MARSGRRPADSGTREAIETAARRQFATTGFARTSLRSIGAEAGVDPGLVSYFFGSKHELLVHVVDLPFDPEEVLPFVFADGPEAAGTHLAAFVATALDTPEVRSRLVALVRAAASEPAAAEMVRDLLVERIISRVVARLEVDDAPLRASLIGSQIVGVVVARHVLGIEPLASLPPEALAIALAPTFQRYLTGAVASGRPPDGR